MIASLDTCSIPLCKLNEEAIQVLIRELDVANTARFIRYFSTGVGNYTEERREADNT